MAKTASKDRTDIYYWKCDRAAAFHGTDGDAGAAPDLEPALRHALALHFPGRTLALRPADGQGNHRTFRLDIDGEPAFVRTEDGPEGDNYFDVESLLVEGLRSIGVPAPRVLACDCSREQVPFAWQVQFYIPFEDLNRIDKRGALDWPQIARQIGEGIARWQTIKPAGFGPFSATLAHATGELQALHRTYRDYFTLNLKRHLDFLQEHAFLPSGLAAAILDAVRRHNALLDLEQGVLVHKDLALWNVLGTADRVAAFIDWDDAISGDPLDDLSLLGCFHDGAIVEQVLAGYARVRPLPDCHLERFWLHLMRNMLFKAVIRVGAGYFKRNDNFFLVGTGCSGSDLATFTLARIETALHGLNERADLSIL
ncbi:MAG: phosphotransferase [Kiritimatiellae bacterium]|jgi:aminoglycoside phosphotransferase (APT) family kinase protein|nr:phosphotransferase [Kiritimatiellia bacterium]